MWYRMLMRKGINTKAIRISLAVVVDFICQSKNKLLLTCAIFSTKDVMHRTYTHVFRIMCRLLRYFKMCNLLCLKM